MVLMAMIFNLCRNRQIIGSLGAGKTLSLTYLAWRNYRKGVKIYSNVSHVNVVC
jgi:hypothetical protein